MFGFATLNGAMIFPKAVRTTKPKQQRLAHWITDIRTKWSEGASMTPALENRRSGRPNRGIVQDGRRPPVC